MKAKFLCLLLLILIPFSTVVIARDASEQDIKAVYLYNFLRFISWPELDKQDALEKFKKNTVSICILGKDSYSHAFKGVENYPLKSDQDQRILIINRFDKFTTATQLLHCQLLFITASEHQHSQTIISALQRKNILLIGESPGFIEYGGMMEFHRVGDKIRWKINLASATLAGFKIDRRLLQSAIQVIHKPQGNNGEQVSHSENEKQFHLSRNSNGESL